jgi:hypothetical protein
MRFGIKVVFVSIFYVYSWQPPFAMRLVAKKSVMDRLSHIE